MRETTDVTTEAGVLSVEDSAAQAIKALFKRQGREGCGFRISVKGGGCSGLQYEFSVAETPRPDDTVIEHDGVTVVIDPKSAVFVAGSVLSYERSLMKEGFAVKNPQAGQSCSCGESFSA
jgi:iron-sulfur cluster assembly protein